MSLVVGGRLRRRPRGPAAGPGRAGDSRAGRSSTISPSGRPVPGTLAIASCSRGSNGVPGRASMGVTPSLSSRTRSLRSMAAMPSNHGSSAIDRRSRLDGAVEVVGEAQDLADEVLGGEAEVALALLGGPPLEVQELGALALEARPGTRRPPWSRRRARRSGPRSAASRAVGETSISSARSSARVRRRSGIEVVHQFVHQAGHEADRADRLGIAHAGRARGRRPRRSPDRAGRTAPGRARRRASRPARSRAPMKTWIVPEPATLPTSSPR